MDHSDARRLVQGYLDLGGQTTSYSNGATVVVNWMDDNPEAKRYWQENIKVLAETDQFDVWRALPTTPGRSTTIGRPEDL
ncbi:hypothetical protein [Pararhizobium sp. LjRoot238]|uniref:hypothetical protein n=1 Tax=Pararhizobium sp. LjRoot238 TaxID=3342293 RepID=UPI003ECDF41A